jgi:hypothetical protein
MILKVFKLHFKYHFQRILNCFFFLSLLEDLVHFDRIRKIVKNAAVFMTKSFDVCKKSPFHL